MTRGPDQGWTPVAHPLDEMRASRLAEALTRIGSLARFGQRPGLERIRALLAALDHPEQRLEVVHIGGTNGKGSVSAAVASIFEAAGLRTGLFISPYLEDPRERIQVDRQPIEPDALAGLVDRVWPVLERVAAAGDSPTEFELWTALGIEAFALQPVDVAVMEVGLGGRYDATNVFDRPLAVGITQIGLDHTQVLGRTHAEIARDKAGIMRSGIPAVTGARHPEALAELRRAAEATGCPLLEVTVGQTRDAQGAVHVVPRRLDLTGALFDVEFHGRLAELVGASRLENLQFPLVGAHQLANAGVALALAVLAWGDGRLRRPMPREALGEGLGRPFPVGVLRNGLAATRWPGRFEVFGQVFSVVLGGPANEPAVREPRLPGAAIAGSEPLVVLDGAHNPDGARALADGVQTLLAGREVALVFGVLGDKDARRMLEALRPVAHRLIVTSSHDARSRPIADLAEVAREAGFEPETAPSVAAALDQALAWACSKRAPAEGPGRGGRAVVVSGSLYVVGQARAELRRRGWSSKVPE